jgi:hypothetical protein
MRERAALPIAYERTATDTTCQAGETPDEEITKVGLR